MELPMREKYVDERVGVWMVFGTHPDGRVDVCNADRDLFEHMDPKVAEKLVEAQERFRKELYKLLCQPAEEAPVLARLGVDGNAAYALFGRDLQTGQVEFRRVADGMAPLSDRQRDACLVALSTLRHRLGLPSLPYSWDVGTFGEPSHG